jgi:segregation and condensation protein B
MNSTLKEIIESLIFISMEPLSLEKIKGVLTDYPDAEIGKAVDELLETYGSNECGIQMVLTGGGYLFTTKPEHDLWIRKLLRNERKNRLSPAALETLSVIAYHQPVTLAEISAVRGVDASHSLKTLLLKRLVKITGRKKAPGKPLIYRTSDKFLTYFGINDIKELPSQEEIMKILDEEEKDIED